MLSGGSVEQVEEQVESIFSLESLLTEFFRSMWKVSTSLRFVNVRLLRVLLRRPERTYFLQLYLNSRVFLEEKALASYGVKLRLENISKSLFYLKKKRALRTTAQAALFIW